MPTIAIVSLSLFVFLGSRLAQAEPSKEMKCPSSSLQVFVAQNDLKAYANMAEIMADGKASLTKVGGCKWTNLVTNGFLVRLGLRSGDTVTRTNIGSANSFLDCLMPFSKIEKKELHCLEVTGQNGDHLAIKLVYE